MHRRFQIATMTVTFIARQASATLQRLRPSRQNRYAVPGRLTVPDRAITGRFQFGDRERTVDRFQLLQAGDVGFLAFKPRQQVWQPGTYAIDVERRDTQLLHGRTLLRTRCPMSDT
ncbi:hypothetical protein D9M71_806380 [compost metagenome]